MKKAGIYIGAFFACILMLVAGLLFYLSVTEYKPAPRQAAEFITTDSDAAPLDPGESITVFSWNTGYAGLGQESDFFMDGGAMVNPPSQQAVEANMAAITAFMQEQQADAWLLQEVDTPSARTGHVDQYAHYAGQTGMSSAYAYNYKCAFVPFPLPPIGQISGGIATLTSASMQADATRISLPCPFQWPVRMANLKRCLLVIRLDLAGTDKQLVLVNLHLEAYDDGAGKLAQTQMLMELLEEEYRQGNYVIAGGDFNQAFPNTLKTYPIQDPTQWTPGILLQSSLPQDWQYAYDADTATCRLLDAPLQETTQKYVIDGFILSPNVSIQSVETVDLGFANSDHNPVKLTVDLK